jgi:hypothetical protein
MTIKICFYKFRRKEAMSAESKQPNSSTKAQIRNLEKLAGINTMKWHSTERRCISIESPNVSEDLKAVLNQNSIRFTSRVIGLCFKR